MKAIFISDLHLDESRADISAAFKQFLQKKVLNQEVDQFYILGDLFEVWIGDDFSTPFIDDIKQDLKRVSEQVPECFFQHGNRDFLVGDGFAEETGFNILKEVHHFDLGEQSILLMHGDSLCTLDTEYMKVREFLRSNLFIQDVLSKTVEERLILAEQLRGASKDANAEKDIQIMDVTLSEVVACMEQYSADVLIHGHTHRPSVHQLSTQHQKHAQRIVMSDWEKTVQYVEINQQSIELKSFSPTT